MASIELIKEEDVERLTRIKLLIKEILELDKGFSLSNIIEVDKKDTLVFTTDVFLKQDSIKLYEDELSTKLNCKCVILNRGFQLDKAITEKKIDYETETVYADGEIISEKTIQYK